MTTLSPFLPTSGINPGHPPSQHYPPPIGFTEKDGFSWSKDYLDPSILLEGKLTELLLEERAKKVGYKIRLEFPAGFVEFFLLAQDVNEDTLSRQPKKDGPIPMRTVLKIAASGGVYPDALRKWEGMISQWHILRPWHTTSRSRTIATLIASYIPKPNIKKYIHAPAS